MKDQPEVQGFKAAMCATSFMAGGVMNLTEVYALSSYPLNPLKSTTAFLKGGLAGNAAVASIFLLYNGYLKIFEKIQ